MDSLYKFQTEYDIYQSLKESFNHPGILLFRMKELRTIIDYTKSLALLTDTRVLDLGCGEGYIGNILFKKIDVGLDVIEEEIKKAKKLSTYKQVVAADARMIPFKAGSFDLVFSNSSIEHIGGLEEVLREVSRILSDQGLFVFTVPSHKFPDFLYFTTIFKKLGLTYLSKIYSKLRNKQLNHLNLLDDLEWERLLNKNMLKIIYKRYYLKPKDIYDWDKICILLRLTKPLDYAHKLLMNKLYKRVEVILSSKDNSHIGGGLLVVAKKD